MAKQVARNTYKLSALMDLIGAGITVKIPIEELQKLPPEKLKAFLDGIAVIASAQTTIERT